MAYSFGVPYHFVSHSGNGSCLNVYGNNTVSQNRNVCVWGWDETNAQKWVIRQEGLGGRIYTNLSVYNYGLNAYRSGTNWNCDIHTVADNQTDSLIDLQTVDASNNLYRVTLVNYPGKYLTAEGINDGTNVVWANANGGTNQIWKLCTTNPNGGGGQQGSMFFEGHIMSHSGLGSCLNVYGNDTISPHQNVCAWEWSNTFAQTWKVVNYGTGYKIHSSLQYPTFALNIYRNGTNNCDVYPHVGNDPDSMVMLTNFGIPDVYYIRIANGSAMGLALTADGVYNGANVRWMPFTGASNQQWRFTLSAPPPPPPPPPGEVLDGADSPLVTNPAWIIPAHTNNYWHDRVEGGYPITEITIHHTGYAGATAAGVGEGWQNANLEASSHYGVEGTAVYQYVREADMAWCNGGRPFYDADAYGYSSSNRRAITIETVNDTYDPNWTVSDATLETLCQLVADIARRNNLGKLVLFDENNWEAAGAPSGNLHVTNANPHGCNLTWHSIYSATICPGPYLRGKLLYIRDRANQINGY